MPIHINNICLSNDYFILDCNEEKSFKGTFIEPIPDSV